jgi:hypothetical protein
MAGRLITLRPAMTLVEAIKTTRIHRVAGLTGNRTALVTTRPCRAPHHPILDVGRIGGGQVPMPGGSLAHHGCAAWMHGRRAAAKSWRSGGHHWRTVPRAYNLLPVLSFPMLPALGAAAPRMPITARGLL